MSEQGSNLLPQQIQQIEDLAAEGFRYIDIAEDIGINLRQFKKLVAQDGRVREAIEKGKERLAADGDKERRQRMRDAAIHFVPSPDEIEQIRELCSLGWSEAKIAQAFKCSITVWSSAKKKFPFLAQAIKDGQQMSGGKRIQDEIATWLPRPEDLEQITRLAAEGFTPRVIAQKLGLRTQTLYDKMSIHPEVREAYDAGVALCESTVSTRLMDKIKEGNLSAVIYWLKSRNSREWTDRPPTAGEKRTDQIRPEKKYIAPPQLTPKEFDKEAKRLQKAHLRLVENRQAAEG